MSDQNKTPPPQAGPVAPAKKQFQSKLQQKDLLLGEKNVFDGVSMLIGALYRTGKENKYIVSLANRLEKDDPGNPLTPYVKTIGYFADEIKNLVDKDPDMQAGLEAAERRMFLEQMGGGFGG